MIKTYYDIALSELGLMPKEFWALTPYDIQLLYDNKNKKMRYDYELASFYICWITMPHLKKPLKTENVFNWEKIQKEIEENTKELTPEQEAEAFEKMFMTAEEKQALRSKSITEKLIEINKKKAIK